MATLVRQAEPVVGARTGRVVSLERQLGARDHAALTEGHIRLPGFLRFLGPARVDNFMGQLAGHDFVPHPYIYGNKIDFKPVPSLELGFGADGHHRRQRRNSANSREFPAQFLRASKKLVRFGARRQPHQL